jgi:uncharacterized membrane protein YphA (DoxX/SURF4 family)
MSQAASNHSRWIDTVLDWPGTWFLARAALTSAYLVGGFNKLFDFPGAVAEQAHFGLQPASLWAVAAIVVEIAGSVLILWGRLVWLAAGALGALTAIASVVADNFWTMQGHAQFMALNTFLEHIGLIGGLAVTALLARARTRPGVIPVLDR